MVSEDRAAVFQFDQVAAGQGDRQTADAIAHLRMDSLAGISRAGHPRVSDFQAGTGVCTGRATEGAQQYPQ